MATLFFAAGTSAGEINEAIRAADDAPLTVILGAGIFALDEPIRVLRDDVTLRGAGIGETILVTGSAEDHNAQAIVVHGGRGSEVTTLKSSTVADGTTTIVVNDAAGITAGMVIQIEQANDQAYFKATGNTHLDVAEENAAGHDLRQMLAEVVSVDGDTLTLRTATPYAFTGSADGGATTARVSIPDLLTGVEISGLTVTSDLAGTPGSKDFTNTAPEYSNPSDNAALEITAVRGLKLHDVATENTVSTAFNLGIVYDSALDNLSARGSFNKGGEGNGYALQLRTAFNNTITNFVDQDMRHSVLLASFSAEHYNTIHVKSTNRDINFHGSADSHNTIVVDRATVSFSRDDAKRAVQTGDSSAHPNATVEANDVTFKYMVGSWAPDIVYAHDSGAKLYGKGRNDELHGGAGRDRLDGGIDDDLLSGGGGSDTFVYRRDYGRDKILDFETGADGDRLDLSHTGITGRSGISARKVGADMVLSLGGGNSLTLMEINKTEYAAMNITFAETARTKGVTVEAWGSDIGFSGTAGDDVFSLRPGNFREDLKPDLLGFQGVDTLRIVSGAKFDVDLLGKTRGIDVVDVSEAPKRGNVHLDRHFIAQTDKHYVVVEYDKDGLYLDTGDILSTGAVKLRGEGQVQLSAKGAVVSAAGSSEIDVLGGSRGDKIRGGRGDDRIDGGLKSDTLTGGGGDDAFVFTTRNGSASADVITDFTNGRTNNDWFEVDNAIWRGMKRGWLSEDEFQLVSGPKIGKGLDPEDRVLYDREHGDVWFDRDGSGDKYRAIKLAEVTDDLHLIHRDFLII
jgi:Ca2+-binding RTX toxin-like protein